MLVADDPQRALDLFAELLEQIGQVKRIFTPVPRFEMAVRSLLSVSYVVRPASFL